jgi:hypothetical protein
MFPIAIAEKMGKVLLLTYNNFSTWCTVTIDDVAHLPKIANVNLFQWEQDDVSLELIFFVYVSWRLRLPGSSCGRFF